VPGLTIGLRYSEAVIEADRRPLLHDVEHEAAVAVVDGQPVIGEQHGEFVAERRRSVQQVLVDAAVLHDEDEARLGTLDERQIDRRVAIDQQQVGERALGDDAQRLAVGIALTGEFEQCAVVAGRDAQDLAGGYQRSSETSRAFCSSPLSPKNRMSVPKATFTLCLRASA